MDSEPIISLRGIRNQFGAQVVHDNLDLDVFPGEVLGVVGGSGTGKSVLLRTIVGLLRPRAGSVFLFGQDALAADEDERAMIDRRTGVMFQDGALFSSLTVRENIEVPMRAIEGLTPDLRSALADLKISMSGLSCLRVTSTRPNCRAGCASAPDWRARWRWTPRSSFWTSRQPGSIRSARRPLTR